MLQHLFGSAAETTPLLAFARKCRTSAANQRSQALRRVLASSEKQSDCYGCVDVARRLLELKACLRFHRQLLLVSLPWVGMFQLGSGDAEAAVDYRGWPSCSELEESKSIRQWEVLPFTDS